MRILIVEDEAILGEQIKLAMETEGHAVDLSDNGFEARDLGLTEPYDAVILDLGIPERDGLLVLQDWRAAKRNMPVLILTARGMFSERIDGLDAGADDYITKPFHMLELAARVRAMLRRKTGMSNPVFSWGEIVFDTSRQSITLRGQSIALTVQETAVLSYLVHHAGKLVSQVELAKHIYGRDVERESNTIAVFVTRLRKKLGSGIIRTIRGRGYMVEVPE